jgi:serine/threonine-protein kinase
MEQTAVVRPRQASLGLYAAAGIGVAALIATVLYVMPHTGSIDVNVADNKGAAVRNLRVSIDGKFQCESAPCQIQNVSSGSHTIKVEATGYDPPADKAVAVESGKVGTIDFTLTPTAPSGGTGIKVAGSQPGEKLFVDDKEIGPLPQEIHDLTPGQHRVRVSAGERYAAVEKTVTIAKDEFQDLGSVTLKVIKARATVTLATPGARVFLVSGSDRRELVTLPMAVDLEPSKQYSLVATKAGYSDFNLPLSFDDGQAEKSFTVNLEPKTASPVVGSVSFSPPPSNYSAPSPAPATPQPRHEAPQREAAPPKETASAGGEGTLNMNSIPASSVTLDGKAIGSTPLTGITVSAGTHTVVFTNVDQNFKKSVSVSVAAGETKKVHP